MSCVQGLFDRDVLKSELDDFVERVTISQGELIKFLWKKSVTDFMKTKTSGKSRVQFDPVSIKFSIYLRSKVNTGTYTFMANVFNLPSNRTLCDYDTLDEQAKEGISYETLLQMENENDQRNKSVYCLSPWH